MLGFDIGLGRALGAIIFAFLIGLLMAVIFRKEEKKKAEASLQMPESVKGERPLWKTSLYFLCMILFLVFSDWYTTGIATVTLQLYNDRGEVEREVKTYNRSEIKRIETEPSLTQSIHKIRWYLAGVMFLAIMAMVFSWFSRDEVTQWMHATLGFCQNDGTPSVWGCLCGGISFGIHSRTTCGFPGGRQ